jgi:hypothetical protein
MKVLTCNRAFPKGHPKAGQPTYFVEKIWACPEVSVLNAGLLKEEIINFQRHEYLFQPKHHTIRAGNRFKVGDMASLRVWSDKPYRSKQIEFAQVEVKKVWSVEITMSHTFWTIQINGKTIYDAEPIAANDGLTLEDFVDWFTVHPKKKEQLFTGQIICWSDKIEY